MRFGAFIKFTLGVADVLYGSAKHTQTKQVSGRIN